MCSGQELTPTASSSSMYLVMGCSLRLVNPAIDKEEFTHSLRKEKLPQLFKVQKLRAPSILVLFVDREYSLSSYFLC